MRTLADVPAPLREILCVMEAFVRFGFRPDDLFVLANAIDPGTQRKSVAVLLKAQGKQFVCTIGQAYPGDALERDWPRAAAVWNAASHAEREALFDRSWVSQHAAMLVTSLVGKGFRPSNPFVGVQGEPAPVEVTVPVTGECPCLCGGTVAFLGTEPPSVGHSDPPCQMGNSGPRGALMSTAFRKDGLHGVVVHRYSRGTGKGWDFQVLVPTESSFADVVLLHALLGEVIADTRALLAETESGDVAKALLGR
jgi:hypothetical protein